MVLKLLLSLHDQLLNISSGYRDSGIPPTWRPQMIIPPVEHTEPIHSIFTRSAGVSSTTPLSTSLDPSLSNGTTPTFELLLGTFTYLTIILLTIFGNILVIVAVFTYQPLNKVQNYLLVSLAASDLSVAFFVMPLHVVKFLAGGHWLLGVTLCQLFTTADILLCTSSILNLCAIALDRYWAIHDPIAYAQKRTRGFVCKMILSVWIASLVISVPPLIGWNDWTSQKLMDHCELTTQKAFVVFSASGSFFLPLVVMTIVYVKIFLAARHRIRANRERSALSKISTQQASHLHPSQLAHPRRITRMDPEAVVEGRSGREFLSVESNHGKRSRSALAMLTAGNARIIRRPTFLLKKRSASHSQAVGGSTSSNAFHAFFFDRGRRRVDLGAVSSASAPTHLYPAASDVIDSGVSGVSTTVVTQNGEVSSSSPTVKETDEKDGSPAPCTSTALRRRSTPPPLHVQFPKSKQGVRLAPQHDCVKDSRGPSTSIQSVDPTAVLKQREKISVAKEKRAAKTIAVIIFCFVGCWVPFFCAYVILPFCESCFIHPKILQAFVWLGYINSSLNPFLYGILNLEFRRAFRKILCPASRQHGDAYARSLRRVSK